MADFLFEAVSLEERLGFLAKVGVALLVDHNEVGVVAVDFGQDAVGVASPGTCGRSFGVKTMEEAAKSADIFAGDGGFLVDR